MSNKAFTISAVMAVLAIFMVYSYISSREAEIKRTFGAEVGVVIAKKDIEELAVIDETQIRITTVPKRFLQPGAAEDIREVVGAIASVPIKEGEQITSTRVTFPSGRTGLSRQVTEGRRAFTIPVNDISGVGRLIKPGDRVDLIASVQFGDKKETRVVSTILQDVPVLAIGRLVTNNPPRLVTRDPVGNKTIIRNLNDYDSFNHATLEVEPSDLLKLVFLLSTGDSHMYLALRNNQDKQRLNLRPLTMKDVMGVVPVRK